MTEMFGEAWSPMSVPDLAPDDDDDTIIGFDKKFFIVFDYCKQYIPETQFGMKYTGFL